MAKIVRLIQNVDDQAATDLMQRVEKVGVDIPLAWPIDLADAVAKHSQGGVWPADFLHADTTAFRYRRTDLAVWCNLGIPPLSVSTDRIGIPAMRAASLMSPKMSPAGGHPGSRYNVSRGIPALEAGPAPLRLSFNPAVLTSTLRSTPAWR